MTKAAFKEAYRAVRLCLAKKPWPEMSEEVKGLTMDAAFLRQGQPTRFGVEAAKTAPDFKTAIKINSAIARYHRDVRGVGRFGHGYRIPA